MITVRQAMSMAADRNFGLRWFRDARAQGRVWAAAIVQPSNGTPIRSMFEKSDIDFIPGMDVEP
jgi:hypothetical protein